MKYIKLYENFLIESVNTNLEMKSVFKNLVNELRKMGLKVKFEYKKFTSEEEATKWIPSKNIYEQGEDAYLVMDDSNKDWNSYIRLSFNYNIDKEKANSYMENVKNYVEKSYGKILTSEMVNGMSGMDLMIKPVKSINKNSVELAMDASKFMGLKRTPVDKGISYLAGSGWEFFNPGFFDDKTKEYHLVTIDDNNKTVKITIGISHLINKDKKDKLVNITKQFAKKNGYQYKAITNDFI
jgi:hypothetical protein